MSKKSDRVQRIVIGCGGLIVLAYICVSLTLQGIEKRWENQLSTLIATDDSISAFGDGAHAVPIIPSAALKVGGKGTVFGIEITVNNAEFIESVEYTYGKYDYWFVEFSGTSTSNEIQHDINPGMEAQLQYLQGDNYIWSLDEFEQRQCDYGNTTEGFELGETFHCRFVYSVPADQRSLYWVYSRTDMGDNNDYEERYVVFQIR